MIRKQIIKIIDLDSCDQDKCPIEKGQSITCDACRADQIINLILENYKPEIKYGNSYAQNQYCVDELKDLLND
jgi:hypothetical protein